jgi:hypothetical protein
MALADFIDDGEHIRFEFGRNKRMAVVDRPNEMDVNLDFVVAHERILSKNDTQDIGRMNSQPEKASACADEIRA